jgi:ribosomal protein S15P/S13E
VIVGPSGLLVLSAEGTLEDGQVQLKSLAYPIENIDAHFKVTETDVNIQDYFLILASGKVSGRARLDDYLKDKKFSLNVTLDSIRLDELLADNLLPVKLAGQIFGKWDIKGKAANENILKETLEGLGELEIKAGKVVGVNLLKLVLDKLSMIPDLQARLAQQLPERYKNILSKKDTDIQTFKLQSRIHDGVIEVDPLLVGAEGFEADSRSRIDLEQNLSLAANVYILPDLSSALVSSIQELSYLIDSDGRISIPLKPFEGKLSKLILFPDIEKIGKRILATRGKIEIQNVIFKALDLKVQSPDLINADSPHSPNSSAPSSGQPESQDDPEKSLLEGVLDGIFE